MKMNLPHVKFKIRVYNGFTRCHPLSTIDRQIETVRGADQYQMLKINVRSSISPVDLLTPGFQFEAIEKRISLQSDEPTGGRSSYPDEE